MELARLWLKDILSLHMIMSPNTAPPAAHNDIEEAELLDMLQTVIDARCGLSTIHQLLDGAQSMSEIRARFSEWQSSQSKLSR